MRVSVILAAIAMTVVSGWTLSARAANATSLLSSGEHDVDLGEVRLHYVVRGKGPRLFIVSPGWGIGSKYLQLGMKSLQKDLTLVFVDTRGSGGSSKPADPKRMSQAVMADDLDELRERLGLETLDLMGHSDGGTIALEYATRHPQHVRNLILVDPGVLGDRDAAQTQRYLDLWSDDPQYHSAVQRAKLDTEPYRTQKEFADTLDAELPLYFSDPSRHVPIFHRMLRTTHLSLYANLNEGTAEQTAARNQTEDLRLIRARTLIINGSVDWICPYAAAQRLQAGIPGSQLSLYVNVGHIPWVEQPARFFTEIAGFVKP